LTYGRRRIVKHKLQDSYRMRGMEEDCNHNEVNNCGSERIWKVYGINDIRV